MQLIKFTCETCKHRIKQDSQEREFEFFSLTDAWKHIYDSFRDRDDSTHEIVAEVHNAE